MAEEIIISGKTFEAAMAEAQSKYPGENVQYEILEMPRRGIFGIGASPAKIKVIINEPEEDDADLSSIVASIKGLKVSTNKGGDGERLRKSLKLRQSPRQKQSLPRKRKKRKQKKLLRSPKRLLRKRKKLLQKKKLLRL